MPSNKIKVLTVVGTRPEIIRLSATIKLLDQYTDHVLVHTGQNYDYELNEVFFEDLGLREPDYFLEADTSSLGAALGSIISKIEPVLLEEKPDAFLILGDTNSAISAVMAKRLKIPVYHMEAGNRSFDENVPEETNRRLVDHISDYNLVYTEHARRNLLAEGIHPSRILLTGSPMYEVLRQNKTGVESSDVLERQGLKKGQYFLVSLHREENVDDPARLRSALTGLNELGNRYNLPVLISTHPRTRKRLEGQAPELLENLIFHAPFGFHDYVRLQIDAKLVLSDSGTISEESSILDFPAVTLRTAIERPESLDSGVLIKTGVLSQGLRGVEAALSFAENYPGEMQIPDDYQIPNTAERVVKFVLSTHWSASELIYRKGISSS